MITLKTLSKATCQEVFDQVVKHLRKQGAKSVDSVGYCKYRTRNGLKCAAGCLIGDDEYNEGMEGVSWFNLNDEGAHEGSHMDLIHDLQVMHDQYEVDLWENRLVEIANKHYVEYNGMA